MATLSFPDLSLLWPFANELDKTLFVYNEFTGPRALPMNDTMAIFTLSTAIGRIAMDDSIPVYHLISSRGSSGTNYTGIKSKSHIIYIGGGIRNQIVVDFLNKCDENMKRESS